MRMIMVGLLALGACGKSDNADKGGGGGRSGAADTEAQLELNHLAKAAKAFYVERAGFPTGKEGPTPAQACCSQPGRLCRAQASDWNLATGGHPWSDLHFEIADDGFKYQYSYSGTAEKFTAFAVGDPDCDGHTITVMLSGTAENGNPTTAIMVDKK